MKPGILLDFDVADRIVLASMQDQLKYLKKELKDFKKGKQYMHPDDAFNSEFKFIPALETLINYYGG